MSGLCARPMAAGPDDIRGLIHSQGARIPHLPRSAAALSWQITAHVSKALSLDPEPGRKPARALGAWDHCLHGKLVFPGAAGCIVTITSGLLAYSLPLFVLLSLLTRGGRGFWAGPQECSGALSRAASVGDFLAQLQSAKVVRCDAAALRLLGLSLAGWNAVVSAGLAGLAVAGLRLKP
jgi:hypothetical protein